MQEINNKTRLVPKLRFKEFGEEWALRKLDSYIELYKERVPANTEIPILTSSRTGLYRQSDYFDNREVANEGEYGVVPRGYFTYRHMSDDSTFKFNINNLCDKGAVSKEYPVFKAVNMDTIFLHHKLNYGGELKRFAGAQKLGGTRVRLYFNKLKELQFNIPSLPEQQKIATFLSAVDEKIQQLTGTKELLAQYKKGVMQQIFSGKLRFKPDVSGAEGENGKEFSKWEEKRLGDVAEINPKSSILPESFIYIDLESVEKGRLIKENRINKTEAPSRAQRKLLKSDILFQTVRPYQMNNFLFEKDGDYVASTGYAQLRTMQSSLFLFQLLHTEYFVKDVIDRCTGTSYPSINSTDLAEIKVSLPCLEEQQKIAEFLSGIDAKIERVTEQITHTQAFKKGLLQQMFV